MVAYCSSPAALVLQTLDPTGAVADSLDLMDVANGYRVDNFDLGFPAVREVVAALPTRDGDFDTTSLFGPRTVTIGGSIIPTAAAARQAAMSRLAHFLQPRLRPTLLFQVDAGVAAQTIGLRGANLSGPYTDRTVTAFSATWVAPDPVAYSTVAQTATIAPASTAGGRTYNLTFNRVYPAGGAAGTANVTNGGDYPTWAQLYIYGPCTNPVIRWVGGTGTVAFTGLSINAGDYVHVDTFAQTAFTNDLPASSVYSYLDFSQTVWQPLYAGTNTLQFAPATFSAPCQLVVNWRDARLY